MHRTRLPLVLAAVATAAATTLAGSLSAPSSGAPAAPSAAQPTGPRSIDLPRGFQPEGIAARGTTGYVGSLADGDIYEFDLRTGDGEVLSQGPGRPTVGIELGPRNRIYAAGGDSGQIRIVDAGDGSIDREIRLTRGTAFINDVVITRGAAWFTDSTSPRLFRVPVFRDGRLPRKGDVRVVRMSGDFEQPAPGEFGANGIDTLPMGNGLVVVNSTTGQLLRVVRGSGRAIEIRREGPALTNGDGLLRDGRILYVVRNRLNRVAVLRLGAGGRIARQVDVIGSGRFDVPTTIAKANGGLYLPNARFTTPPTPRTPYSVTRVTR